MVTNFEYYSKLYPDLMIELLSNNKNHNRLAYNTVENKLVACYNMDSFECQKYCKFYNGDDERCCAERIEQWLKSPYEGTDNTKGEITW